jgi:flagellar motility protein MotE (MotC chaperone)
LKLKFTFPTFLILFVTLLFTHSSMPAETVELTSNGELQDKTAAPDSAPNAGQLISAIEKRKVDLDKRADEIEQENQRLQALKSELTTLLARYTQIKETAKKSDAIDANQLEHLTKMYEAMPPKDAALRIERLKEPLALKLLSSIKPKAAAKILNEIKPARAAHLTERLAKTVPPPAAPAP